jgi:hypothetical protein
MLNVNVPTCACCKHCALNGKRTKNLLYDIKKKYAFQNAQLIKILYDIIRVAHFHSSMSSILNSKA